MKQKILAIIALTLMFGIPILAISLGVVAWTKHVTDNTVDIVEDSYSLCFTSEKINEIYLYVGDTRICNSDTITIKDPDVKLGEDEYASYQIKSDCISNIKVTDENTIILTLKSYAKYDGAFCSCLSEPEVSQLTLDGYEVSLMLKNAVPIIIVSRYKVNDFNLTDLYKKRIAIFDDGSSRIVDDIIKLLVNNNIPADNEIYTKNYIKHCIDGDTALNKLLVNEADYVVLPDGWGHSNKAKEFAQKYDMYIVRN